MFIRPISSPALSFGNNEENKKSKSLTVPLAAVGALAGGGFGYATKIKADPSDLDSFISSVDSKLPKSAETRTEIKELKARYGKLQNYAQERLNALGITPETKELSVEDIYKRIIHPDTENKNMTGLDDEIKFIQGKVDYMNNSNIRTQEFYDDIAVLKEKKLAKRLIESSEEGKVPAQAFTDFHTSAIRKDVIVNHYVDNITKKVKGFNKTRIGVFAIGGTAVGAIAAQFLKGSNKKQV